MPELPDVEIFKKYFDSHALNHYIREIRPVESRIFKTGTKKLKNVLEGHSFDHSHRVGKYLFARIKSDGYLVLHFGMTGYLKFYNESQNKPRYEQLDIVFSNGYHLGYISKRKFGRIDLADEIDRYCEQNQIGPDAAELDSDRFSELLKKKRGRIKSSLMDQSLISGLGNIYVDEILFQARIHPEAEIPDLDEKKLDKLYTSMREVIRTAISREADPSKMPQSFLIPNRREGAKCPDCRGTVRRIKVNNRGTYICPSCQQK